jgi:hypothetical protein
MKLRARAYAMTLLLAGLVASPLFGAFPGDSFPVSTYPMFASARSTEVVMPHAIAITTSGEERRVRPREVANDEVIQAFETIRQAIRQGQEAIDQLCGHIARNVAHHGDVVMVQIVTSHYDGLEYFAGDKQPKGRWVEGECAVPPS